MTPDAARPFVRLTARRFTVTMVEVAPPFRQMLGAFGER
jgi:hypothetical protein